MARIQNYPVVSGARTSCTGISDRLCILSDGI